MKKWSYVTALMLAASTGCVFTGCIDNDEPYGIEQIRLATADLMKSKKALFEAQAAAANAEVEIAKIQAEIEKAKLENEKLQAAAKAEIDRLQAEAQAAKTKAEAERILAMAEAIRMEAQAKVDSINAETARYIAKTQEFVRRAQLCYEKAVAAWELEKLKNEANKDELGKVYQAIEDYYENYLAAINSLNFLNESLLRAQTLYAQYNNDLIFVPAKYWYNPETKKLEEISPEHWEAPSIDVKKKIETAISEAEDNVASAQEEVSAWDAFVKELEAISEGELASKLAEAEAALAEAKQALVNADADWAAIKINNEALFTQKDKLAEQKNAAEFENIAIPEYTYEPNAEIAAALPGFLQEKVDIVGEDWAYSLKAASESAGADRKELYPDAKGMADYNRAVMLYSSAITGLSSAILDENDKAWTNAQLVEMERTLASTETPFAKAKALWESAVKAYKGVDNKYVPDAAALPGDPAIQKAIADFAAAGTELEPLRQKVAETLESKNASEAASEKAIKDFETIYGSIDDPKDNVAEGRYVDAYNTYLIDLGRAENKKANAIGAAALTKAEAYQAEQSKVSNAKQDLLVAQAKYAQALVDNAADSQAVKDADTEVKNKEADLKKIEDKVSENEKAADKAYDSAVEAANVAYAEDVRDATADWNTAKESYKKDGGENPEIESAFAVVQDAAKNFDSAVTAYSDAEKAFKEAVVSTDVKNLLVEFRKARKAQRDEFKDVLGHTFVWTLKGNYASQLTAYTDNVIVDGKFVEAEFPVLEAPVMLKDENEVYVNAKQLLIEVSDYTYGTLGNYDFAQIVYENTGMLAPTFKFDAIPDLAFLVDVTPKMANKYLATAYPNLKPWQYVKMYETLFGEYGKILALESKIQIAKASLKDNAETLINELIAPLEANLKDLKDGYEEAKQNVKDLNKLYDQIDAQCEALLADAKAASKQAASMVKRWGLMVCILKNGLAWAEIKDVNVPDSPDGGNSIDAKDGLEKCIKDAKANLEIANKNLANMQKELDDANYMMERLTSGEADYVINPYTMTVESLKSQIAVQSELVEFYKNAVESLQAKYEAYTSK